MPALLSTYIKTQNHCIISPSDALLGSQMIGVNRCEDPPFCPTKPAGEESPDADRTPGGMGHQPASGATAASNPPNPTYHPIVSEEEHQAKKTSPLSQLPFPVPEKLSKLPARRPPCLPEFANHLEFKFDLLKDLSVSELVARLQRACLDNRHNLEGLNLLSVALLLHPDLLNHPELVRHCEKKEGKVQNDFCSCFPRRRCNPRFRAVPSSVLPDSVLGQPPRVILARGPNLLRACVRRISVAQMASALIPRGPLTCGPSRKTRGARMSIWMGSLPKARALCRQRWKDFPCWQWSFQIRQLSLIEPTDW